MISEKNITHVWYEIELDSQNHSETSIAKDLWLNFKTFESIKWHNLLIKMSKEYYWSTIEFNFAKEEFSSNLNKKVKKFTKFVMNRYQLNVFWRAPSFVWTHMHFFRSGLNSTNTDTILKIVIQFILENIKDLHINSIERLICSHQLWWNYARSNTIIRDLLWEELWKSFSYPEQARNRPKYQPVIQSPRSTTWKLRSTEIRFIPTEFILNDKILILIERLKVFDNIPNEDVPSLYLKLITHYKWLLKEKKAVKTSR